MSSFGDIRWEANNKLFAKFSPFIEFHHFYMNANFISLQPFTFSHRQGFCDYKFSHSTFSTMRLLKLGKTFPRRNAKKPDIDLDVGNFGNFHWDECTIIVNSSWKLYLLIYIIHLNHRHTLMLLIRISLVSMKIRLFTAIINFTDLFSSKHTILYGMLNHIFSI